MFERFTEEARHVVEQMHVEASRYDYMDTEHLLLALLHDCGGIAQKVLNNNGVTLGGARAEVVRMTGRGEGPPKEHVPFTPRCKKVLELSLREALQLGHNYIAPEHVLLALVREGEGKGVGVLLALSVDLNRVRRETIDLLGGKSPLTPQEVAAQQRTHAEILAEIDVHAVAIMKLTAELNQQLDT